MSLTEILAEIPKLSFAERQEIIRRTLEVEEQDLTPDEKAILDERLDDFRRNPNSGFQLIEHERQRTGPSGH